MLKLIKRYVPYALVIAAIYLIMPIFFQGEKYVYNFIEYQLVFPATALLSGLIYCWRHGLDFTIPLFPPVIYIGSVLIYSHYYHWHIYVFIYLIVCMLGCFIGDMAYRANIEEQHSKEKQNSDTDEAPKIKITNISVHSVEDFDSRNKKSD